MELMNYLVPFLILLTVVVFIHEYGHYYFAKRYGVKVTDFSIGFGKEIFGWNDKSGTRWKICLIPLGGYVKFFGDRNVFSQSEQNDAYNKFSKEEKDQLFVFKPLYQRSLIVAAGPIANYVLAIFIFSFIYMFSGKDMTPAVINEVMIDSPAFVTGLKKNDKILSINGRKVESILEVSALINTSMDEKIKITIDRNRDELEFHIKPNLVLTKDSFGNEVEKKIIGIKLAPLNNEFKRNKLGPAKAVFYSLKEVIFVTTSSIEYLFAMIKGKSDSSQLGGPIRIAKITGQVSEHGLIPFLSIMAYISVSLGFINLFPIPMLDGGHLMFYAFEKILGRPLTQKTQEGFFRIGLFLLLSLMVFVTFNDLKDLGLF
ncbi:MAG: RIP metalloprotease RseP [Candidatus Pelagibacter sp. TMED64]|nr:RIP metalloprotease RseP [Candidatus Pelagibacter sp.]OUU65750.1 MAG: RIP metalloprotease RseP [Candidatus Pelagibacter sp. TMED64]